MSEIKPSHVGRLYEALGIPKDRKISMAELISAKGKAKRSGNAQLSKQASPVENVRK